MDLLQEIVQAHGACATRAMLDEVIKQEQKRLETQLKDINLYMSETPTSQAVVEVIETKLSSVAEQLLAQRTPKAEQRAAEAAKRVELSAAGVDPHTKLTKENLEKWLAEGKSFSQIAREEVGLRQEEVSSAAKKYNLKPAKKSKETMVTITKEE
jgi:hypothetical protein